MTYDTKGNPTYSNSVSVKIALFVWSVILLIVCAATVSEVIRLERKIITLEDQIEVLRTRQDIYEIYL